LIEESKKRRQKLNDETVQQRAERIKAMKNYWQERGDTYNENRRKRRAEARAKLVAENPAHAPKVGRPKNVVGKLPVDLGVIQQQAKLQSGYDDLVTQHVDYTEIPIPKELGKVFNDLSESPAIMIAPDASTWPMYHIRPFNKLKGKTRTGYLSNFALAMKMAGYTPPANKENDLLVYSHWYSENKDIDPFKVVKANSAEYTTLSTGVVNGRA
jgi:hypothetical protein